MRSSKIASVKKIGIKQTMDIEVNSKEHVFYGNGIATSNSHAVAYAKMAYWSAYIKYYYPLQYYLHWLRNADEKIDPDQEKKQLILSAKSENITIYGPTIKRLNDNFELHNDIIYFGLCNVKNVGRLHLQKLKQLLGDKDMSSLTWTHLLFHILPHVNKKAIENLINVGAFAGFKQTRTSMLHEFKCIKELTDNEISSIIKSINFQNKNTIDILSEFCKIGLKRDGGFISSVPRKNKILELINRIGNPGRNLEDNPSVYSKIEEHLLGYPINISELNSCADACHADTKCDDIINGKNNRSNIAVILTKIREHKTKNNDTMVFISAEDDSGELDNIVIFPDVYEQHKDIIYIKSTVLLSGEIKDKKRNSFIVDNIFAI